MNNNDFLLNSTNIINWKGEKYSKDISTGHWLQSICYVSTDNAIVVFYAGDSNTLIEKISLSTYQVTSSSSSYNYGHVNDATYNPTTQKIYLTPMLTNAGQDKNLVYVLNKDSFAKESEIHIGNDNSISVYGIAYDSTNDIYYVAMSNSIMAKLDNNFNIISTYSFNPYSLPITVFQNLEVYNEKLFLVYNDKLTIYDINGTMIKSIAMDSSIETDGFVSISGGNFLVGKIYQSALNNTFIHKNTIHQFNIFDSGLINPFLNIQGCVKTNGNISIVNGVNFITKRDHTVYCNICFQGLTSLSSQQ